MGDFNFSIRDPQTGVVYRPKPVTAPGPWYASDAKIIDVPAISWHGPSTCLSRIVYNERAKTLLLTFRKSGRQYSYSPVPPELAQDLLNARSKGRFFNFEIKSVYG